MEEYNGYFAAFGKVTEGLEILDEFAKLEKIIETDQETGEPIETTIPVNQPVIRTVTVETFGEEYEEPETHEAFDIEEWLMNQSQMAY